MDQTTIKEWMKVIPESEWTTYRKAGFMEEMEAGQRMALLVVDATYGFTGSEGLTLEESIAEFPTACGPASWEALPKIAQLLGLFRSMNQPIIFTRGDDYNSTYAGGAVKSKSKLDMSGKFNDFPDLIQPLENEWVLDKTKASAFFQTSLTAHLIREGVNTVVVCGVSTSGCVRATAVDSHSHGFTTFVIDECCFDRSYFSHCTNLFDLNAKYANVLSLAEFQTLLPAAQSVSL
ncbi:isochorismatase family protein [Paenibacillus physcomitrellae]|uniref:N-carbamoylsarcosine amidase n=1 Tax=Paenibacillus physcomitrellae TaxID=1619311 RepID=A0ABQ1FS90_9BACL|nr:isochorismatase family protein [Paenibacillus physcomitrellae]GGA26105.1 N-carbamoylsarcosine amidase [Paenibacillus physcomitrellae]